jgi:hypothetical protein
MATEAEKLLALRDFFAASFTAGELEIFLRLSGYGEVASAVNPNSGSSEYFFNVVGSLDHRGWINEEFFEQLKRVRPGKEDHIRNIRDIWGHSRSNRVLIIEHDEWQNILRENVRLALGLKDSEGPNIPEVVVVTHYQDGLLALGKEKWNLAVIDMGLPPGRDEDMYGMRLVSLARQRRVPCIVVSGIDAFDTQLVAECLIEERYKARYFYSKDALVKSAKLWHHFHDLVWEITDNR